MTALAASQIAVLLAFMTGGSALWLAACNAERWRG